MNSGMVYTLLFVHKMNITFLHTCLLGIPVAWGITDVEDTNRYTVFFSAIRKRVPDAVIDILMTDDGQTHT